MVSHESFSDQSSDRKEQWVILSAAAQSPSGHCCCASLLTSTTMLRKIFSSRTSLGTWALEAKGDVLSRTRKLSSSAQVTEFLATTTKKVGGALVDNSRWNQHTPSVRKWTKGELSFLRPGVRGEIDKTEVLSNSSLFKVKTREETKHRKSMEDLDVAACLFTSMHNTAYFSNFVYCSFGRPYGLVTKRIFWDVWFYDTFMITFASFNFICYCSYSWPFTFICCECSWLLINMISSSTIELSDKLEASFAGCWSWGRQRRDEPVRNDRRRTTMAEVFFLIGAVIRTFL